MKLQNIKLHNHGLVLKEIDLSKGREHTHPDISIHSDRKYLALIDGRFYSGSFSKAWFGLNFHSSDCLQFDAPSYNRSDWMGLWEIVEDKKEITVPNNEEI